MFRFVRITLRNFLWYKQVVWKWLHSVFLALQTASSLPFPTSCCVVRDTFGILFCWCRFQTFPRFVHVITSILPQSIYHLLRTHTHTHTLTSEGEAESQRNRKIKKRCSMCLRRNPPLKQKRSEEHVCIHNQPLSDRLKWCLSAEPAPVWDRPVLSKPIYSVWIRPVRILCGFSRRYHLFVYTSWKWFVSNRQSRWLSCVPPHAVKMSSCLTLNADGPRQGFNQSFLAEESATQHPLTTWINDQAAFHQLLTFSLFLFMCVSLEAHFSEMSFVCESGHVFMCVCAIVFVFVCHALSRQSIHPLWLTPRVSCCLRRLINDPFA